MGRVFGMGIASFAVIGGAFTGIFYLILTIIYIVIGAKKIDDWRPWMIAVNIAIHIVMFFLGFLGASYFTALTAPNLLT
jgi:hypothetical protein